MLKYPRNPLREVTAKANAVVVRFGMTGNFPKVIGNDKFSNSELAAICEREGVVPDGFNPHRFAAMVNHLSADQISGCIF